MESRVELFARIRREARVKDFAVLTRQWALDLSTSGGTTNLRSFKQAS
ncbi:UNVERIFIED_ORG: hypothetical protein ABIB21_000347 [Arthrobacter sp. UYEF13]